MSDAPRRWLPRALFTPRKLIAVLFLAGLVAAFVYQPTEDELRSHQERWKAAVEENPWLWAGAFFAAEVVLLGLSVPVASGTMIVCGFLFGRWRAALIISASAPLGALLAMLASRYLFRNAVRQLAAARPRIHAWSEAADRGIERDGWYYLLLLRLTPVIPFFIINLVMGLTRIRPWTFLWVTALGMLPATLVFVNAGATAAEIRSASDLVSVETVLALTLLILFPVALRTMLPRSRAGYPA
jgi:uncharacterized membrane protein YdjX (TVP38/TMEM64 family)